jgi:hypothetical protein
MVGLLSSGLVRVSLSPRRSEDVDLPAPVAAAAKAKHKKARWEKVEEITTDGKITHELTVKKADGGSAVAIFDSDGKLIGEG